MRNLIEITAIALVAAVLWVVGVVLWLAWVPIWCVAIGAMRASRWVRGSAGPIEKPRRTAHF